MTGSLHAGLAQWLAGSRQPAWYVASQGTVLGRADWGTSNLEDDQVSVGDAPAHDRARERRPLIYSRCVAGLEHLSVAFLMDREDVPCLRL